METISSTEAKLNGILLSNTTHMHLDDDLDQAERKTGRVTTLNEIAHNVSFYFGNIMFYFTTT
jgi:hypothetical protein